MFSHEKTPWFPADVKPARPGYYDTRVMKWLRKQNRLGGFVWTMGLVEIRLFFDGKMWKASRRSKPYTASIFVQSREWRGLKGA